MRTFMEQKVSAIIRRGLLEHKKPVLKLIAFPKSGNFGCDVLEVCKSFSIDDQTSGGLPVDPLAARNLKFLAPLCHGLIKHFAQVRYLGGNRKIGHQFKMLRGDLRESVIQSLDNRHRSLCGYKRLRTCCNAPEQRQVRQRG